MNDEMKEASNANLQAGLDEIARVLTRRQLAAAVLVTDGMGGRVLQQLCAPWNAFALDDKGNLMLFAGETPAKIRKSVCTVGIMAEMGSALATELQGIAYRLSQTLGGAETEVTETPLTLPAQTETVKEGRARRCRVCGCTEENACRTKDGPCHWIGPNLCSAHEGAE